MTKQTNNNQPANQPTLWQTQNFKPVKNLVKQMKASLRTVSLQSHWKCDTPLLYG